MSSQRRRLRGVLLLAVAWPALAQEWTERELVERFLTKSPHAQGARALVAAARAEARGRALYANPSLSYSRESAGFTEFLQVEQTLPISGRTRALREAGSAGVAAVEGEADALLWLLRSDLRQAFYRLLAAQERIVLVTAGVEEIGEIVRDLRTREEGGEGSRYDRLRTERELTEQKTDRSAAQSTLAAARARVAGFLPEGTPVSVVKGDIRNLPDPPALEAILPRALAARADYRAEERSLARFKLEEHAARKLRIPEPIVTAGLKRADIRPGLPPNPLSGSTPSGLVFGVTVPLLTFNRGQYEVARVQAEQQRGQARLAVLERQIRTEVEGAYRVLLLRRSTLEGYEREQDAAETELTRIARLAYQEGELGILELLDALRVNRQARLRVLDLRASAKEAQVELDRVVGEEVQP